MYKIQDDNLLQDCEKYLTIDTTDGTVFNSKYSSNNSKYQAQFTKELDKRFFENEERNNE